MQQARHQTLIFTRKSRVAAMCVLLVTGASALFAGEPDPLATQPSSGVNLLTNGTFEKLDASGLLPAGWSTVRPDNVRVINSGDERNRVVEMTGNADLMGSYGVDLLSDSVMFKANTRYRCMGYIKTAGPNAMLFVKGYASVTRKDKGVTKTFDDEVYQMVKNIDVKQDWSRFSLEFDVKPANVFSPFQHEIKYLRVLLWGCWPKGTLWWDDIRFEEVGPIPGSERRHEKAVTHQGIPANLGPSATQPEEFDAEQAWADAANALLDERFEEAAKLSEELVRREPTRADYRLALSRAAVKLARWDQAKAQSRWLLSPENKAEPWQVEWATLVDAQVSLQQGDKERATATLRKLATDAKSPHVRQAATELLPSK
jgi:hypothetical protein